MQTSSKATEVCSPVCIFLIVALLLAVAIGGIYLFVFRGQGDVVKVTVNGELYGIYSLSQDIIEDIHTGENGEELNRLVIRDGKVFVELPPEE